MTTTKRPHDDRYPQAVVKDGIEYEDLAAVILGKPIDCWRNNKAREIKLLGLGLSWTWQAFHLDALYDRCDRRGVAYSLIDAQYSVAPLPNGDFAVERPSA